MRRSFVVSGLVLLSRGALAQDAAAPAVPAAPAAAVSDTTTPYVAPTAAPVVWYEGNAVPGRNFPPPPGCTVKGKAYWPQTHPPNVYGYTKQNGWDWCQSFCKSSMIGQPDGSQLPCAHFAFYPDGKCYLQDSNTTLTVAPDCNATNPCEHGYQVVSGPASCDKQADWADPTFAQGAPVVVATTTTLAPTTLAPTTLAPVTVAPVQAPKVTGHGGKCNPSLPPEFAVLCEADLVCVSETGLLGESGTCMLPSEISTTVPPTLPPPPTMPPMPTEAPPPADATILGYYYEPMTMTGTTKMILPSWRACYDSCKANPYCRHFAFWPDGGCHEQGNDVTLIKAPCEVGDDKCAGLKVISGPRDLEDKSLWPKLNLPAAQVAMAAPTVQVSDAPKVSQMSGAGEGGLSTGTSIGIGLGVLVLGGAGFFAYRNLFAEEGESEADEEASETDSQQPILAP